MADTGRPNDNETSGSVDVRAAASDYEMRLTAVRQLKDMCDTPSWQNIFRHIQSEIQSHARDVLEAEKSREVIFHQQGVKVLRSFIKRVRQPVDDLNDYVAAMPLLSGQMPHRARWVEELGIVEVYDV